MKKNLFLLISIILLLSCSNDDYLDKYPGDIMKDTIGNYTEKLKNKYNITKEDLVIDHAYNNMLDTNQLFINGQYNDRLWIGGYDKSTKKQLLEWQEKEKLKTSFTVHKGYGEYVDVNIDRFTLKGPLYSNNNLYFILSGHDNNVSIRDLYFIRDNHLVAKKESISGNNNDFYEDIYPWHNGIMVKTDNNYSNSKQTCFSADGDSIYTANVKWYDLIYHEPINMQESVLKINSKDFNNNKEVFVFKRNNLKTDELIWESSIEAPETMQSRYKLDKEDIGKNENIWTYTHYYTSFEGDKFTVTIIVDIETGELSFDE